ncbi:MAG: ribonuclease III [Clostridia bacterium]|nr:ribonuclease III [Clostridia bacterium]
MYPLDFHELEGGIGYAFRDPLLLRTALTHSSFANEHMGGRAGCNERLEFLGDSVLSLTVCNYLYRTYPELPEGRLTVLRKNLVCQRALADYATQIHLGDFLLLGKGEAKDGREKPKLLEDAFEALLGAIYLDSGNLDTVADFLLPFIKSEIAKIERDTQPLEDYKTLLQQYVQQTPGEELRYELISEEGPDNAKIFAVRVLINSNCFGEGQGTSKKEAEQNAAREALKLYLPK